jgi:GDSL-like Lipase/Acylhydrolase family
MGGGEGGRRSFSRQVVRVILSLSLTVVILEAATRIYFANEIGERLYYYGTPWHRNEQAPSKWATDPWADSVQNHQNHVGAYQSYELSTTSYSKYFPGEIKWTQSPDRRERYTVRINNHGFRGEDYAVEKAPGTIRVLTLGASSTFGYHDRDDETYPFLLEEDLQRTAAPGTRFEVINFAIPHATTDNILAMFLAEGVQLRPDVVTFYEGVNDCVEYEPRSSSVVARARNALARHSLLVAFLDGILPVSEAVDSDWWWSDELAALRSRKFLGNLQRLADECQRRGIVLVVATQQVKSFLVPDDQIRGVSYDEEVAIVRDRLRQNATLRGRSDVPELVFKLRTNAQEEEGARVAALFAPARVLLIHSRLMDDLRTWAAASNVGFVDMIHELDERRDLMVNWVHLTAEANAIVAKAFARTIRAELDER